MSGFRMMAAIQMSGELGKITADHFPASYSDRVRKLGVVNNKNKFLTALISLILDGPAFIRSYFINRYVVEDFRMDEVLTDDAALEAFIRKATIGVWHASCSCRMGAPEDPMSVVDTNGRVKGIEGLRVVDASIFPVVPCANTNFPTLMAAEKIADAIIAEQ
jgi:5-(hydroxymethyl)furfural/furfural oxidase